MASIEDILKDQSFLTGAALGLGAALLAPLVLPVLGNALRPVTKSALKAGIVAYEKGRESLAELGELIEDAVAEARAEMEHSYAPGATMGAAVESADFGEPTPAYADTQVPSEPKA